MKKVSSLTLALISVLLVSLFTVCPTAVASTDDWPMYQHDSGHTGYSPVRPLSNPVYLWNFTALEGFVDGVSVSDDVVFFMAYDTGNVFAINASTGQLIWKSPSSAEYPVMSCPAVMNGVVYTATDAYNTSTGHLIFNYTSGSTSATAVDGVIYLGGTSDIHPGVMALNARNGQLVWSFPLQYRTNLFPSGITSQPVTYQGIVYFSGDGVYAIDAQTGSLMWHYGEIGGGWSTLAVSNGYVYVADEGRLSCLDALTGKKMWNFTGISLVTPLDTPAIADGYVYAGSYALNASTGDVIWNNSLTGLSAAVVVDGVVYYGHYRHTDEGSHGNWIKQELLGFNSSTDQIISNYTIPDVNDYQNGGTLAVANGNLYVSEGLTVYAFSISEKPSSTGSTGQVVSPLFYVVSIAVILAGIVILIRARRKKPKLI